MNPEYQKFFGSKRMTKLWEPYPELLAEVHQALAGIFESVDNSGMLDPGDLRLFAEAVMGLALTNSPLYSLQKVAYRIEQTSIEVIAWSEARWPNNDFFDARKAVNHFDGLQGYAGRLLKIGDFSAVARIVKTIRSQGTGKNAQDYNFVNSLMVKIAETKDLEALDKIVKMFEEDAGTIDIFIESYCSLSNVDPSVLIHVVKQVANGVYDPDNADVQGVVKGVFDGLRDDHFTNHDVLSARALAAVEACIASEEERFELMRDYHIKTRYSDNKISRFFTPSQLAGRPFHLEIMDVLNKKQPTTWRSRAALNYCMVHDPKTMSPEYLVMKYLHTPLAELNQRPLEYCFSSIIDTARSFNDDVRRLFFIADYNHDCLNHELETGEAFLQVFSSMISGNVERRRDNDEGPAELSRNMVKILEKYPSKADDLRLLWAMLNACNRQDDTREFLAKFYSGNFKSLNYWIKLFDDDPNHYAHMEWVNESRLQVGLGL